MPRKKYTEGLGEFFDADENEPQRPFSASDELLRSKILKGSAERIPPAPDIVKQTAAAALSNAPAAAGGLLPFGGAVALDVGMSQLFPPTASELRGQAAGGLAELLMRASPRFRQLSLGKQALANMMGQTAGVGLEQAGEFMAGQQSGVGSMVNTFMIGSLPAGAQEAIGKLGRAISGKTDQNVVDGFQSVMETLDEFGVAAKTGSSAAQGVNNILAFVPFASDQVTARDRRLVSAMFSKFQELGLSPDVSLTRANARPGERTIEDIGQNAARQFTGPRGRAGEIVDIIPEGNGKFRVRSEFAGAGKGQLVKLSEEDVGVLNKLRPRLLPNGGVEPFDPGAFVKELGTDGSKIHVIETLGRVLPPQDGARIQNAFINEFILGPSIERAKFGVNVDELLSGRITRDAPNELLEVRPRVMRDRLSKTKDEKMLSVLRLGGHSAEHAQESLAALKSISQVAAENNVNLSGNRGGGLSFLNYASNKFIFGTLAIGAANLGEFEESNPLSRFFTSGQQIAAGAGLMVGIGTAISLAINHPRAAKALTKVAKDGPPAVSSFMRAVADTPFQFVPVEGKPGVLQLVDEPRSEWIEQEEADRSPQGLADFLGLRQPRANPGQAAFQP